MAARAKFESDTLVGAAYALGAFVWWGLNPIYFKAVGAAPVFEVLAHRVLWSVLFLALLIQLLLGALLYREPFTKAHLVTFALIWTAIALYSPEAVRAQRAAVAAI